MLRCYMTHELGGVRCSMNGSLFIFGLLSSRMYARICCVAIHGSHTGMDYNASYEAMMDG